MISMMLKSFVGDKDSMNFFENNFVKKICLMLAFLVIISFVISTGSQVALAGSVRIETEGWGSTDPIPGTYDFEEEIDGPILAIPYDGHVLDEWRGCYEVDDDLCYVHVDPGEIRTVTAVFMDEDDITEYFDLTVDVVGEGSTVPSVGVHSYEEGEEVSVDAFADDGWEFSHWEGDCSGVSCSVVMDGDRSVTAVFEEEETFDRSLEIKTEGAAGSTDPLPGVYRDDDDIFGDDGHVTILSVPYEDTILYEWKGCYTSDVEEGICEVFVGDGDHRTVTAVYVQEEHELTVNVVGGGSTNPSEGVHTYKYGEEVSVDAFADDGWEFSHWEGDCSGVSCSVVMDGDRSVTAVFEEEKVEPEYYDLTVDVVGEGSTVPSVGVHSYEEGEEVDISAEPKEGWVFDGWTGDIDDKEKETTITMDSDKHVVANFVREEYELEVKVKCGYDDPEDGSECGSTTPEEGVHTYKYGEEVTIEAFPSKNWEFSYFMGDCHGEESTCTLTMDGDKEVIARFNDEPLPENELTIEIEGEGTTNPPAGTYTYKQGEEIKVTAYPEDGWYFSGWTGDIVDENEEIYVTVDEDKTITANFEEEEIEEYKLDIKIAQGQGTTSPEEGTHYYEAGETVEVQAFPAEGYRFIAWSGAVEDQSETITITMDSDKELFAYFRSEIEPYVKTNKAEDITDTSAKLRGELIDLASQEEVKVFFKYREKGTSEWISTSHNTMYSPGLFEDTVEILEPETSYEFKAVVRWNGNERTGSIISFVTDEEEIDDPEEPRRRRTIFRDEPEPDPDEPVPDPDAPEPTANAGYNRRGVVGEEMKFHGIGRVEEGEIVEYRWDFNDDGYWEYRDTEDGRATHVYQEEGLYTAVFEVETDAGKTASDSVTVEIVEDEFVYEPVRDTFMIGDQLFNYTYNEELDMTLVEFSVTNRYDTEKILEASLNVENSEVLSERLRNPLEFYPTPEKIEDYKVHWRTRLEPNETYDMSIEADGRIEMSEFEKMEFTSTLRDPRFIEGPIGYITRMFWNPWFLLVVLIAAYLLLYLDEDRRDRFRKRIRKTEIYKKVSEKLDFSSLERDRDEKGRFKKESKKKKRERAEIKRKVKNLNGKEKSSKKKSSSKKKK